MTFLFYYDNLTHASGAVAEQIGSGLQNRVHRCESGPRLQILAKQCFSADAANRGLGEDA